MTPEDLKRIPDRELKLLRTDVNRELRRRRNIAAANANWTNGQGLETCLEASISLTQKKKAKESK